LGVLRYLGDAKTLHCTDVVKEEMSLQGIEVNPSRPIWRAFHSKQTRKVPRTDSLKKKTLEVMSADDNVTGRAST
jgi:hypothetical protein